MHRETRFAVILSFMLTVRTSFAVCDVPRLVEERIPRERCAILSNVCVNDSELVLFDEAFNASALPLRSTPQWPWAPSAWNHPSATNSDAIAGNQPPHFPRLRAASRMEARPHMQAPSFSACTLPIVLLMDWPYNVCEVMEVAMGGLDAMLRQRPFAPDRTATLVVSTPAGMGLQPFHRALLAPYSMRPPTTLDDLGRQQQQRQHAQHERGGSSGGSDGEERGGACFARMVVCKLLGNDQPVVLTGAVVLAALQSEGPLPSDPLRFEQLSTTTDATTTTAIFNDQAQQQQQQQLPPDPTAIGAAVALAAAFAAAAAARNGSTHLPAHGGPWAAEAEAVAATALVAAASPADAAADVAAAHTWATSPVLRVLFEARRGGARTILNLHALMEACHEANKAGFAAGPFTGIACRVLHTAPDPASPLQHQQQHHGGSGGGSTAARFFRTTVAAVRSAHVLVAVHGAGTANAAFMRHSPPGHAALLEIRPCGFGTAAFAWWVDVHMARHLPRCADRVVHVSYNVEDPDQCSPSDWARAAAARCNATAATAPPRCPPVNTRAGRGHYARDQHLTLRPGPLLAVLRHVAGLLRNVTAVAEAQAGGWRHAYGLPGGQQVALGPAAVANASVHAALPGTRVLGA